jgi:hypothetical protein
MKRNWSQSARYARERRQNFYSCNKIFEKNLKKNYKNYKKYKIEEFKDEMVT